MEANRRSKCSEKFEFLAKKVKIVSSTIENCVILVKKCQFTRRNHHLYRDGAQVFLFGHNLEVHYS